MKFNDSFQFTSRQSLGGGLGAVTALFPKLDQGEGAGELPYDNPEPWRQQITRKSLKKMGGFFGRNMSCVICVSR